MKMPLLTEVEKSACFV